MSTTEYFRAVFVEHPPIRAVAQIAGGTTLAAAPAWVALLQEVNLVLATFSALCGAIVGGYGVYRLWKHTQPK